MKRDRTAWAVVSSSLQGLLPVNGAKALRWFLRLCCLVVFLGASALATYAQTYQGMLRGAVSDPAGAVIPGVQLTLTNEETNLSRSTVTNNQGEFAFPNVLPGTYTLTAVQSGFKKHESKGIRIGTQTAITLDIALEVGPTIEEIVVTEATPLLESSNATVASTLEKTTLELLPTAGRNAFFLSIIAPNIIPTGDPIFVRQQDQTNSSLLSLGGGPRRGYNYLIEGVPITDLRNRAVIIPSIEAIEDVKVHVRTYDAEMGRTSGGIFNTTFKSGSNEWHGSAVFQNRPGPASARLLFDRLANRPKPSTYFYLFGGSVGGPIVKNRTFFYVSAEGYQTKTTRTEVLILPTQLERTGDYSQSGVTIYDPLTTQPDPANPGRFIRDPFPGNVIPPGRINPVAGNLMQLLPTPTAGRSFPATASLIDKAIQFTVKADHKLTDKYTLTGTFAYYNSREPETEFFPGNLLSDPGGGALFRNAEIVAINNVISLTTHTTLSFRYGFTRFADDDIPEPFDPATLGFSANFVNAIPFNKFPQISVAGYNQTRFPLFGDRDPQFTTYYGHNVNGSVTRLIGRHTLKFGGDFRIVGMKLFAQGQPSGTFAFTRGFSAGFTQPPAPFGLAPNTGDAIASLLLGFPASGNIPVATPNNFLHRYFGGYVQDDFRLRANFALNIGLRYEYETGLEETQNRFTVGFDRARPFPVQVAGLTLRGGLMYAGVDGYPTRQTDPSNMRFGPRFGFAWTLFSKTILRGGYGLYWAPGQYPFPNENAFGTRGFTGVTTYFVPQADVTQGAPLDNPFPGGIAQPQGSAQGLLTGAGGDIHFVDQFSEPAYVQQYSLDLQRELPRDILVTLGYQGSRGLHLWVGGTVDSVVNINQLDPSLMALGSALTELVTNPFFGNPVFGALSGPSTIARGRLLRPYPQFGDVVAHRVSSAESRYNSGMVKVERRIRQGWGMNINYTFSHLDDSQFGETNFFAFRSGAPLNNYDNGQEFSRSLLDTPHRLNISGTIELPFGQGKRWLNQGGALNAVFGGWALTGIESYQSGFPIAVFQDTNNTGLLGGRQRPNLTGVDPLTPGNTNQRLGRWMDPAAWSAAPAFTFGNAPRTDTRVRTPRKKNWDLALQKTQQITEGKSLMVRAELINAFNNPNYRGPAVGFGLGTFGRITAVGGFPRLLQLTVRFAW